MVFFSPIFTLILCFFFVRVIIYHANNQYQINLLTAPATDVVIHSLERAIWNLACKFVSKGIEMSRGVLSMRVQVLMDILFTTCVQPLYSAE